MRAAGRPGAARQRRTLPGLLTGSLLGISVLAGCGSDEPAALQPLESEAPADLCATIPVAARQGLHASATSDATGHPTASCSLRSADGTRPAVAVVVSWLQLEDETAAATALDSQCRAVDRKVLRPVDAFTVDGADRACGSQGVSTAPDQASLAASFGREVLTVRYTSAPAGPVPAVQNARIMMQSVIAALVRP